MAENLLVVFGLVLGKPYWRGRLSMICTNLFSSVDFDVENIIYLSYKTSFHNVKVNGTEPSLSLSVPWLGL